MNKTKVLIIGAGSIGALKPSEFDSPESKQIYTHAHACYSHPNVELVGIMDVDEQKAIKAATKWNTYYYSSLNEFKLLNTYHKEIDIVIVAVNTQYHVSVIEELIPYKPKTIICEKPFTTNYAGAKAISEKCKQAGIKLIINYNRQWVPELQKLSETLKTGVYGEVYNFTLRYSRGLLREASHALNWCLQTFGDAENYQFHGNNLAFDSPMKGDASALITFETKCCPSISFIPIGGSYSTYNADIYTEKGRIELLNNWKTIRVHDLVKSTYGDYPATGLGFVDEETQLDQALTYLLDYAIKEDSETVDATALEVLKLLNPSSS